MIQQYSVNEIDDRVARGLNIGEFIGNKAPEVPTFVRDWNIHVIYIGQTRGEIVAVPTNSRTREIYNRGRLVWLVGLGFEEEKAKIYLNVSSPYKHRWETPVAKFVLDNLGMEEDIWYDITRAKQPGVRARELGLDFDMSETRLKCAMQLLMNMWEQEPEA